MNLTGQLTNAMVGKEEIKEVKRDISIQQALI
jgi:hypothetical protein